MANKQSRIGTLHGRPVYATGGGMLRYSTKGPLHSPAVFVSPLSKSDRRRVRKMLDGAGLNHLSRLSLPL